MKIISKRNYNIELKKNNYHNKSINKNKAKCIEEELDYSLDSKCLSIKENNFFNINKNVDKSIDSSIIYETKNYENKPDILDYKIINTEDSYKTELLKKKVLKSNIIKNKNITNLLKNKIKDPYLKYSKEIKEYKKNLLITNCYILNHKKQINKDTNNIKIKNKVVNINLDINKKSNVVKKITNNSIHKNSNLNIHNKNLNYLFDVDTNDANNKCKISKAFKISNIIRQNNYKKLKYLPELNNKVTYKKQLKSSDINELTNIKLLRNKIRYINEKLDDFCPIESNIISNNKLPRSYAKSVISNNSIVNSYLNNNKYFSKTSQQKLIDDISKKVSNREVVRRFTLNKINDL